MEILSSVSYLLLIMFGLVLCSGLSKKLKGKGRKDLKKADVYPGIVHFKNQYVVYLFCYFVFQVLLLLPLIVSGRRLLYDILSFVFLVNLFLFIGIASIAKNVRR